MNRQAIADYFGGLTKAAKALGVTKSAAYQWKETVPERIAYRAQELSHGELKVDPTSYGRRQ